MHYAQAVSTYWQQGYRAPHVESWVFRVYGRILQPDFGIGPGSHVLDWGCGQGAALRFFADQGCCVYGVDLSPIDLDRARHLVPEATLIQTTPTPPASRYLDQPMDLIVAIQALYYLSDPDRAAVLDALYDQLRPGGVIYASMMGTRHWYFEHSRPHTDGLRLVTMKTARFEIADYPVRFTESADDLLAMFSRFAARHVGYYDYQHREDEGPNMHYTFIGQKPLTAA